MKREPLSVRGKTASKGRHRSAAVSSAVRMTIARDGRARPAKKKREKRTRKKKGIDKETSEKHGWDRTKVKEANADWDRDCKP